MIFLLEFTEEYQFFRAVFMMNERGSNATMYYTTMYKNGKMYNLEVLYDEISNTVYHFEYARKVMGNLPVIPK